MNKRAVYGLIAAAMFVALPIAQSLAFGTVSKVPILGQDAEHEKITRAALSMLGPKTLDELAGVSSSSTELTGNFGAVGAPDDPARLLLTTDEAHCDNGDYLDLPPGQTYPQTREAAQQKLVKCRKWMGTHIGNAVEYAGQLAKPDETNTQLPCGPFVGRFSASAKCNMIEELGLALHASEDFYSHTNWVDQSADGPTSAQNPPGLGHTGPAPWLDLRHQTTIPEGLISGCFTFLPETIFCNNSGGPTHTKHENINKDKGTIIDGIPGLGRTDRGKLNGNFERAVNAAIADTRDKWAYFEELVRMAHGAEAETILCAIRSDDYQKCVTPVAEQSVPTRSTEDEAAAHALAEAREMLSDLQKLMEQANTVASQLQQSCAAGQALGLKLESSVAAAEVELGNLEAAQTGPNRPADTAAVKSIVLAAASTADAAGKNVARARTIAQQQSDAACKLAVRISTATADGRVDINKELQNTQFAAQQTDSALQMARGELTRAKGAEQRAQTALAGLTPHASGGDALRGHLGEMLASAKELANFAASLSDVRKARLAPLVDNARPIFKEAGERIDAGATGEELEILKQVRQAYLPIADADEALARCANVMAATATAVQSRLSSLSDRTAKLATVNTAPAASNRDMAAIRDAAADATASVETAEVFLAPIEGLNNEAQNCLTRARNGGNRILAVRNEASLICTKSYPGSVVTSIKNGEPQCGCPSGWSWNLADNACVTDQVRRTEEQRVCSNLPGSVFDSIDPADKRAICACPDGLGWNDQRTACVRVVAGGEPNANETPPDPADAFGNALANIITKLAQAQTNNASGGGDNGGGQTIAPNTYDTQPGSSGSSPARGDANDWGVYRIGPVNQSPEVVHGSKAAILARAGGSFVGLGLSSETAGTLVARGEWKIEEVSRASSYEEAHQQYQALYSKATPSQYWGPFIRINDNLINKYNNTQPFGAPR